MNIKRYHLMIWMLSLNKFLYWKRNSSHLKSQRYILHYLNNNKHKTSVLSRAPNQLGRFIAHSKQTPSFFLYATNKTNALTCNYISRSSPSSWCVFVFLLFHSNFQRQIFPPFLAQNKTSKTLLHFSSSRICFSFSFSNRYLGQSTCTDAAVAAEGGCCYHAPHTQIHTHPHMHRASFIRSKTQNTLPRRPNWFATTTTRFSSSYLFLLLLVLFVALCGLHQQLICALQLQQQETGLCAIFGFPFYRRSLSLEQRCNLCVHVWTRKSA